MKKKITKLTTKAAGVVKNDVEKELSKIMMGEK